MRALFLVAVACCSMLHAGCAELKSVNVSYLNTGTNAERVSSLSVDKSFVNLQVLLKNRGLEVVKTEPGTERARVWAKKGNVEFLFELVSTPEKGTRIKFSTVAAGHDAFADTILTALLLTT